jgi:membrane protein YdbS with pleckstrin-like domain
MFAERPDRMVLIVWRWMSALRYLVLELVVLAVVMVAWTQGASVRVFLVPVLVAGLYAFSVISLRWEWESWTYRIAPETLEMNHGWLFRRSRTVARDRIQHLDVTSGPFDRKFGIVHVVVHTAGATVGTIPGLSPERAERLRVELFGENV